MCNNHEPMCDCPGCPAIYEITGPRMLEPIDKQINEINGPEIYIDQNGDKWEKIKVKLDTGAIEWVFRSDAGQVFTLQETEASANKIPFYAANGTKINNFGGRSMYGYSNEGFPLNMDVNVAEVKSNLGSGMRMVEADNRIVLDKEGSFIENKRTGSRIKVNHENGSFTFDFWVPAAKAQTETEKRKRAQFEKPTRKPIKQHNKYAALEEHSEEDDDHMTDEINVVFVGQEEV